MSISILSFDQNKSFFVITILIFFALSQIAGYNIAIENFKK
jgi:hypothetical protein